MSTFSGTEIYLDTIAFYAFLRVAEVSSVYFRSR